MDVTAVLGPVTGVGSMVSELASRLPLVAADGRDGGGHTKGLATPALVQPVEWTGFVVSARGKGGLAERIPPGWRPLPLPYPARLAHRLWRSVDVPTIGGFDLVHGPNYVVPPAGSAARLVTVHDLTAWRYPEMVDQNSRFFPEHLRRAIDGGAHVHAVSRFVADELANDLGVPTDRIHVVANGYDTNRRSDPDRSGGREQHDAVEDDQNGPDHNSDGRDGDGRVGRRLAGGSYVLAVGTVEPRKDHIGLVTAMVEVWSSFPDLRLVIVGQDGWGSEALTEAIDRLDVADRVTRFGYVDDRTRDQLLAGAELLAFPSLYEGFGLPILEAMGAGIPVVSTTAGAVPEVAGDAAVLVPPRDPAALAQAILEVLVDDRLRSMLRSAGAANVSRFCWDRSARDLLTVYEMMLGQRIGVGTGA